MANGDVEQVSPSPNEKVAKLFVFTRFCSNPQEIHKLFKGNSLGKSVLGSKDRSSHTCQATELLSHIKFDRVYSGLWDELYGGKLGNIN